jgi:NDP-sugar pyrophosphorylase family protein
VNPSAITARQPSVPNLSGVRVFASTVAMAPIMALLVNFCFRTGAEEQFRMWWLRRKSPRRKRVKNAIILAGGKGERLRPLTESKPKCMVPVLGNPLLAFQLRWLKAHGIENVVICCGYLHDVIQEYFGDGSRFGLKIDYLVETEPLGRGGALKNGLRFFLDRKSPVLALNGDAITNLNITALSEFHSKQNALATLVSMPLVSPYGIVAFGEDPNVVTGFTEKPQLPFWINAGIYALSPDIYDLLPDKGDHEDTTFPQLANQGKLLAFRSNCFWKPVDTIKDLSEMRTQIESLLLDAFFTSAPAAPVVPTVS